VVSLKYFYFSKCSYLISLDAVSLNVLTSPLYINHLTTSKYNKIEFVYQTKIDRCLSSLWSDFVIAQSGRMLQASVNCVQTPRWGVLWTIVVQLIICVGSVLSYISFILLESKVRVSWLVGTNFAMESDAVVAKPSELPQQESTGNEQTSSRFVSILIFQMIITRHCRLLFIVPNKVPFLAISPIIRWIIPKED
jgi:hypothetical protein